MTSIQLTATVSSDGRLTTQLPASILPGEHQVVLVIDELPDRRKAQNPTHPNKLRVLKWKSWPAGSTFRREELYEDEGR